MDTFSELAYERPALGKIKREANNCLARLKAAKTFAQADEAFLDWHEAVFPAATLYVIAEIRNSMNTKDAFYAGEMKYYNRAVPLLAPLLKKSLTALLQSRFRPQFEEKYGAHFFRSLEARLKTLGAAVILPTIKENNLTTLYSKTAAGCSAEFMGEKCNFYGLLRHIESPDRDERKAAFEAWAALYEGVSPKLEEQYGALVRLRCGIAKKLGYPTYIDYIYPARGRFDYTAADAARFREAVKKYIVPLCEKLRASQAARLGLERLQWYDEKLTFPEGNAVPKGTPEELVGKAARMYAMLSPETDEFFSFMTAHGLFDLVTREGKHLGGYCTALPAYRAPFIFSNFNGTAADIDVLTHEAGHAFQCWYAGRRLPLFELAGSTSEINEIHSMAMELFTYPYMELFFGENADRYRYAHFADAVTAIPYLVAVDEFQHLVFEHPGAGPAMWRRFWKDTEKKYLPWRGYDGNEFLESGGFWMQKQHVFLYPFYYIDYALAQLGAFALYEKQTAGGDAWSDYLTLCGMGGQYGYFETLARAGIPNPFEPGAVKRAANFAERHISALESRLL